MDPRHALLRRPKVLVALLLFWPLLGRAEGSVQPPIDSPIEASPMTPIGGNDTDGLVPSSAVAHVALAFSVNCYNALAKEPGNNVLFAPFDVLRALAVVGAGARGPALAGLRAAAKVPSAVRDWPAAMGELTADLTGSNTVLARHALRVSDPLRGATQPYAKKVAKSFENKKILSVINTSQAALASFMSQALHSDAGTLTYAMNLLPKAATAAVPVEVFSLTALAVPFQTSQAPRKQGEAHYRFRDGKLRGVTQMGAQAQLFFAENEDYKAVQFKLSDERFGLMVMLPNKADNELTQAPSAAVLEELIAALTPTEIKIELPAFAFEVNHDLTKILRAFGAAEAFKSGADYAAMAAVTPPLSATSMWSAVGIDVDERRVTLLATSGFSMGNAMGKVPPVKKTTQLQTPIFIMINETNFGVPLVMGRVASLRGTHP